MKQQPRLIVNHRGRGNKVLTTLLEELESCQYFEFSVAFITQGGVACIIETLSRLKSRGVRGRILTSQYLNFTQPHALETLMGFSNIDVRMMVDEDFHSKGYLFDRIEGTKRLYLGSSNLTQNALTNNIELNVGLPDFASDNPFIRQYLNDFEEQWARAAIVDPDFIKSYGDLYDFARRSRAMESELPKEEFRSSLDIRQKVRPNKMQKIALNNLEALRSRGEKKALIISATGTGKTFLSAFDVHKVRPKRVLFVVHRRTIAQKSMETFQRVISDRTMGLYSGNERSSTDYLFATVQTIARDVEDDIFEKDAFDYIVVDETHRADAASYQKILSHFNPGFLLGMTATPERTDGGDIFKLFNHNIAYEIRLHKALEENMLVPFHYYGISDLTIDGEEVGDHTDFNRLISDERAYHLVEKASFYKSDSGRVRGLIFCSRQEEAKELANKLNELGLRCKALVGSSHESERQAVIRDLELGELDYILTVDIFNEGVDIPSVNQIIMLRPTQSAIIFVQQLGRGLRVCEGKEYLTVIDFIGNYSNSYLIPIALYGDASYNKDNIRKLLVGGSQSLPGACTIDFDRVAQEKIFEAIDRAKLSQKRDLKSDYEMVMKIVGRVPLMMDFVLHGSRDPYQFVEYSGSLHAFAVLIEKEDSTEFNSTETEMLSALVTLVNDGKRLLDSLILRALCLSERVELSTIQETFSAILHRPFSKKELGDALRSVNLHFDTVKYNNKLVRISEKTGVEVCVIKNDVITRSEWLSSKLRKPVFKDYLLDSSEYSLSRYSKALARAGGDSNGFLLYEKYSRRDATRLLGWDKKENEQNIGGYKVNREEWNCPIFVTYHKSDDIEGSIAYDDEFLSPVLFKWMSRSKRRIDSPELEPIINSKSNGLRISLFVKKDDNEGIDFYYLGDIKPADSGIEQQYMPGSDGRQLAVVKFDMVLEKPVESGLYKYLVG
jgi:superfamily II DNA or RNA helicase/HKD family nuclease